MEDFDWTGHERGGRRKDISEWAVGGEAGHNILVLNHGVRRVQASDKALLREVVDKSVECASGLVRLEAEVDCARDTRV